MTNLSSGVLFDTTKKTMTVGNPVTGAQTSVRLNSSDAPQLWKFAAEVNNAFTFSVWMRKADNALYDSNWVQTFGFGASANNQAVGCWFGADASGINYKCHFMFFNNDFDANIPSLMGNIATLNSEISTWHMYTFTYDATTKVRNVYMDGVRFVSNTATTALAIPTATTPIDLFIGQFVNYYVATPNMFADFRGYARKMSDADVMTLYRRSMPRLDSSIVGNTVVSQAQMELNFDSSTIRIGVRTTPSGVYNYYSITASAGVETTQYDSVKIRSNQALTFENATVLGPLATAFNTAFTFNVWMRSDNYNNTDHFLFTFGNSAVNQGILLNSFVTATTNTWTIKNDFNTNAASTSSLVVQVPAVVATPTSLNADKTIWHMYTVTWNSFNKLRKVYMDGVRVAVTKSDLTLALGSNGLSIGNILRSSMAATISHSTEFRGFNAWTSTLREPDVLNLYQQRVY